MLDEPITVCAGNRISGTIEMIRNPKWRRHMTVKLDMNITGDNTEEKVIIYLYATPIKVSFNFSNGRRVRFNTL